MIGGFLASSINGVPVFYIVPIVIFLPIVLFLLFKVVGLGNILFPPREVVAERKRAEKAKNEYEEKRRQKGLSQVRPDKSPKSPLLWALQAPPYIAFAIVLGIFSSWPGYTYHAADHALIKLSLSHPGKRKVECRKRTREELAKLPPNMRTPMQCSRERWPVLVELKVDGETVFRQHRNPAGLLKDGASSFYEKFAVPAGTHKLNIGINDTGGTETTDFVLERSVDLKPAQALVVGFHESDHRIFLK